MTDAAWMFPYGPLLPLMALMGAWSAWTALGFDPDDVGWAKEMVLRGVASMRGALVALLKNLKRVVASHMDSRGPRVGLEEVSEMIDVVRLGLTAGLSFDAALGLYCECRSGLLSEQLGNARLSWQMGIATRGDALHEVADSLRARPIESFARAVSQALDMGAPLAETLAAQSLECREAHRAAVERKIEQAPIKILVPTGTLILPALLLSIMGPLMAAGGMI